MNDLGMFVMIRRHKHNSYPIPFNIPGTRKYIETIMRIYYLKNTVMDTSRNGGYSK
eukprot:UN29520